METNNLEQYKRYAIEHIKDKYVVINMKKKKAMPCALNKNNRLEFNSKEDAQKWIDTHNNLSIIDVKYKLLDLFRYEKLGDLLNSFDTISENKLMDIGFDILDQSLTSELTEGQDVWKYNIENIKNVLL